MHNVSDHRAKETGATGKVLRFALMVLGSPWSNQSVGTALRFARSAVQLGHSVERVFFYHDGIYAGNQFATPSADIPDYPREWAELADQHGVDLVICIASAVKRGVLAPSEARRHGHPSANLAIGFDASGLGQLVAATIQCDRVVSFGP